MNQEQHFTTTICRIIALSAVVLGCQATGEAPIGQVEANLEKNPAHWKSTAVLVSPATTFAAPVWPLLAYDTKAKRTLLFGGMDAAGGAVGTWSWSGSDWTMVSSPGGSGPSARSEHAMAYDAARGKLVVFGGMTCAKWDIFGPPCSTLSDTWEFDGTTWTRSTVTAGPSARAAHAMTYDPTKQRVLLHGGRGGNGNLLGDLWSFDGSKWTLVDPGSTTDPVTTLQAVHSRRIDHTMAVDPESGAIFMFGGTVSDGYGCDRQDHRLWKYDTSGWKFASSSPMSAMGRFIGKRASLIYDPSQTNMVLYGGHLWESLESMEPTGSGLITECDRHGVDIPPQTSPWFWRSRGSNWDHMAITGEQPASIGCRHCGFDNELNWDHHGITYDEARNRIVMFGGFYASRSSGVWEVATVSAGNQAPVIAPIADRQLYPGRMLSVRVSASDADRDPLTLSAVGLPPGATFLQSSGTNSGDLRFTPKVPGEFDVTFVATDGTLSASRTMHIHAGDVTYPFAPKGEVSLSLRYDFSKDLRENQFPSPPHNQDSTAPNLFATYAVCNLRGNNPGELSVACSLTAPGTIGTLGPTNAPVDDEGRFGGRITYSPETGFLFSGAITQMSGTTFAAAQLWYRPLHGNLVHLGFDPTALSR